jgi:hypothetical protein
MTLIIGQKVICVKTLWPIGPDYAVLNEVYTVREIVFDGLGLLLHEIILKHPNDIGKERAFLGECFKPAKQVMDFSDIFFPGQKWVVDD